MFHCFLGTFFAFDFLLRAKVQDITSLLLLDMAHWNWEVRGPKVTGSHELERVGQEGGQP